MVNSIALSFVYHSDEDIISSANNKSQRQSHKGDHCDKTSWFPLPWWTQSNNGDDSDSNGDDLYENDDGCKSGLTVVPFIYVATLKREKINFLMYIIFFLVETC